MKKVLLFSAILFAFVASIPSLAAAAQQPEMIAEKMAIKFTRGVANTFTCIAEVPKQTVLTVRELGTPGYLVGPLKGVGMMLYRGLTGVAEAVFFMVPQPGYYDPLIEPVYVWRGWAPKRDTSEVISEEK